MKQKITLIVPAYNEGPFIDRCIASIKNQTVPFDQVIFIDDCSTDGTLRKLLKVNRAPVWTVISFLENHGVSFARNTGIDQAKGDWVTFLDADDELLPDAYEQMAKAIEKAKGAPVVQLNHLRYYAEIDKLACKYKNQQGIYTLQNPPKCWCMVWNKLIKTEWLKENRIRFKQGLQHGEDELFNLEMLREHPFIACAEAHRIAVKRHFDNKQSLSHSKGKEELRAQINALEEFLFKLGDDEKKMKSFVMDLIADHWQSPTFKRIIGGIE